MRCPLTAISASDRLISAAFSFTTAGAAEEAAEVALRRSVVRAALAGLSARERELVALKYFAGLDNSEIADVLGISESNAGTRLHRVIEKLREECDDG